MSYQPSGESGQFPASYGGGLVEAEAPAPKPFLTPLKMLAIFLQINLLTYFDRGALASVLDKLKLPEQFDLSNTQAGILGGAYMAGYVVASPIFAHYAHTFRPMRMMAFGLTIWAIATAVTGLSPNYGVLVVARAFTGVGEASFLCLAPPFIDKFAPPSKRSLWLSIFFIGIPVGYAFGTIFADTWTGHAVFGTNWTWRTVFLLEGIIMAPYIIFATFVKADFLQFETAHDPVQRKLTKSSFAEKQPLIREPSSDGLEVDSTTADLVEAMAHAAADLEVDPDVAAADKVKNQRLIDKVVYLVKNALYVLVVLAYSAQTFVTGGFAYWGVNFVQDSLNIKNNAGLLFGGITAAMGVVGTGFGGWVLDHYRSKAHLASKEPVVTPHGHIHREDPAKVNQSLEVAFRLILIFSIISWPAAAAAFLLSPKSPVYAFVGLAVAEFCLFSCISPINSAIMWTVPFEYNPIAVAMSVVGNHVLGDATSPTIIGAILDATGNNWVLSMNIGCCWLGFSIIFFFIGWRVAVRRVRQTPLVSDDAADGNEPLLHGGHPYSPITEPARV